MQGGEGFDYLCGLSTATSRHAFHLYRPLTCKQSNSIQVEFPLYSWVRACKSHITLRIPSYGVIGPTFLFSVLLKSSFENISCDSQNLYQFVIPVALFHVPEPAGGAERPQRGAAAYVIRKRRGGAQL